MNGAPLVLAFDTSTASCAAALACGGRIVAARREDMARGQAERLFPMLEDLLGGAGVVWKDLGLIAVGTGPGNFTGTRIAVSAARGLALSIAVPAMGVSRFEALRGAEAVPDLAPQLVCIAGQRDQVFVQYFVDGKPEGVPLTLPSGADMPRHDRFAPETSVLAETAARIETSPYPMQLTEMGEIAPTLAAIAAARVTRGETAPPRPAPVYIRAPDAAPPRDAAPLILP